MNIADEYYFFPIEIKLVNEGLLLLMITFSVWWDNRCDFELHIKNKTSYDALLIKYYSFIVSADNQLDSGLAIRRASMYAIFMSKQVDAW